MPQTSDQGSDHTPAPNGPDTHEPDTPGQHHTYPMSNKVAFSVAGVLIAMLSSLAAVAGVHERGRHTLEANHARARHALEELAAAQEDFRASARADRDRDGVPEFGDFGELAGQLSVAWGKGTPTRVTMHGYVFQLHLGKDAARRERAWRAYAWPEDYGASGKLAFTCGQSGDLLINPNDATRYSGTSRVPPINANIANRSWRAAH